MRTLAGDEITRLTVQIPKRLHRRLRIAVAEADTTQQALVMRALENYLDDLRDSGSSAGSAAAAGDGESPRLG